MPAKVTATPGTDRKPVLVFVPGLGADGSVYAPLLNALRGDFDVRSADHSLRFPLDGLSWDFFFESIDRALGGEPGYLVGHSMGGAIALRYAARHPERVRRVVTVAPVLFPFQRERHRARERTRNALLALTGGHPLHVLHALRTIRRRTAGGRARKLYDFVDTIDLSTDLPRLRQATILFPEQEEIIPHAHGRRVPMEFPNVVVKRVPGSHHAVALAPRKLLPLIREELHD